MTIRGQVIDIAAEAVTRIRFATVPANVRIAVRRSDRDAVCIWIGEMQADNGGIPIEELVRLAQESGGLDGRGGSCRDCDCRHFSVGLGGRSIGCECACHVDEVAFDLPAFIRALVGEALGANESWFETHQRFHVPAGKLRNERNDGPAASMPFIVPPLTLPHATEADSLP